MRCRSTSVSGLLFLAIIVFCSTISHAQAALLMEEPYGFFGTLNPTGHAAVYFEHICADTPVHLRPCNKGEMGSVIARYQGISGYDWVAMPLLPYLYATSDPSEIPTRATREIVGNLRIQYHDTHLTTLGKNLGFGDILHGGWSEFVGVSYERRIYAFRFATTPEQDAAFISYINDTPNRSRFNLLGNNCADFARKVLNFYFPKVFGRAIFPDAGITTPKQISRKLTHYACKHPELQLAYFEISQVPGYRRRSRSNKNIAESLVTTPYAIPIVIFNPYLAGGLFVDYFIRGRFHPSHPELQVLTAETIANLQETPNELITAKPKNSSGQSLASPGFVGQSSDIPGSGSTISIGETLQSSGSAADKPTTTGQLTN